MTTMKHEAATDVATFAPSNKETLPETKALLNQVVADLYVLTLPFTKYTGICVDVALWFGIQKWTNTWTAWMQPWMK